MAEGGHLDVVKRLPGAKAHVNAHSSASPIAGVGKVPKGPFEMRALLVLASLAQTICFI